MITLSLILILIRLTAALILLRAASGGILVMPGCLATGAAKFTLLVLGCQFDLVSNLELLEGQHSYMQERWPCSPNLKNTAHTHTHTHKQAYDCCHRPLTRALCSLTHTCIYTHISTKKSMTLFR